MWSSLGKAVAGNVRQNVKRAFFRLDGVRKQMQEKLKSASDKSQGSFNKDFDTLRKEVRLRMLNSRFVQRVGDISYYKYMKKWEEVAESDVIKGVLAGFKKCDPLVKKVVIETVIGLSKHIKGFENDGFEYAIVEDIVNAIFLEIAISEILGLLCYPTGSGFILFVAKRALILLLTAQRNRNKGQDNHTSSENEESAMTSESSLSDTDMTSITIEIQEMVEAYESDSFRSQMEWMEREF